MRHSLAGEVAAASWHARSGHREVPGHNRTVSSALAVPTGCRRLTTPRKSPPPAQGSSPGSPGSGTRYRCPIVAQRTGLGHAAHRRSVSRERGRSVPGPPAALTRPGSGAAAARRRVGRWPVRCGPARSSATPPATCCGPQLPPTRAAGRRAGAHGPAGGWPRWKRPTGAAARCAGPAPAHIAPTIRPTRAKHERTAL